MKWIILITSILVFTGCGAIDRAAAQITGDGSETCHGEVVYLQFTSGTSVKYLPDGSIATCGESK